MTRTANETYGVSAQAYLARARKRLKETAKPSIFYAALELHCCVEARQEEYIQHLSAYRGRKVQAWRIGENHKKIAKISGGKVIAKLSVDLGGGNTLVGYHTPVPAGLVQYCERHLNGLRHAQNIYRSPEDPWWTKQHAQLLAHYRQAWVACQGDMLVPPLWGGRGRDTHPLIFEVSDTNREAMERMSKAIGVQMKLHIAYLDEPPEDWVCDL